MLVCSLSFIHFAACTCSLTHSLTHLLSHSLAHSLTHSLAHSLTHSLTHLPIPPQVLNNSFTHSSTYSNTHWLLHTFVWPLVYIYGDTRWAKPRGLCHNISGGWLQCRVQVKSDEKLIKKTHENNQHAYVHVSMVTTLLHRANGGYAADPCACFKCPLHQNLTCG